MVSLIHLLTLFSALVAQYGSPLAGIRTVQAHPGTLTNVSNQLSTALATSSPVDNLFFTHLHNGSPPNGGDFHASSARPSRLASPQHGAANDSIQQWPQLDSSARRLDATLDHKTMASSRLTASDAAHPEPSICSDDQTTASIADVNASGTIPAHGFGDGLHDVSVRAHDHRQLAHLAAEAGLTADDIDRSFSRTRCIDAADVVFLRHSASSARSDRSRRPPFGGFYARRLVLEYAFFCALERLQGSHRDAACSIAAVLFRLSTSTRTSKKWYRSWWLEL